MKVYAFYLAMNLGLLTFSGMASGAGSDAMTENRIKKGWTKTHSFMNTRNVEDVGTGGGGTGTGSGGKKTPGSQKIWSQSHDWDWKSKTMYDTNTKLNK